MSDFADTVQLKLVEHDDRFDKMEQEFRKQNQKYDHLINTIDGSMGRIDLYETELAARL